MLLQAAEADLRANVSEWTATMPKNSALMNRMVVVTQLGLCSCKWD